MSTENKPTEAAASPASAAAAPARTSRLGGAIRLILPAVLAAGAAYGGTRVAAAHGPAPAAPAEPRAPDASPPGPTVPLEPFLLTIFDAGRKPHPMKLSIAVEFNVLSANDPKALVPRVRDAVLSYLRTLTHEDAIDPSRVDKMRAELLARCRAAGAVSAERVLLTDFVVQ